MDRWSLQRIAAFVQAEAAGRLTRAEARRLAEALAREPLADVWLDGVQEGRRRERKQWDRPLL